MRRSKSRRKVTAQEWFYLGCLVVGAALGIVAVSIVGSKPVGPDHQARLLEVPGVVPWYTLGKVRFVLREGKGALQFGDSIMVLNGKYVKLRGYITPLQAGSEQAHFILSSKPPSCAFCAPAGADEMVEVFAKAPLRYSLEPVTVGGTFAVLEHDQGGLLYRMADAAAPEGKM